MPPVPTRAVLSSLRTAASGITSVATLGLVRPFDSDSVSILSCYPHGIGEFVLPTRAVPDAVRPSSDGPRHTDVDASETTPLGEVQWRMLFGRVPRIATVALWPGEQPARLWFGLTDGRGLSSEEQSRFETVAGDAERLLETPPSVSDATERSRRLEVAAELLPALLHVLDVRDVFDRLSTIAKQAVSHDVLLLRLFNEDLTTVRTFAQSGHGADIGAEQPHNYPANVLRAWHFDIGDDHAQTPVGLDDSPTRLGARSSLRVPVRFDDRVIGGLAFLSVEPEMYSEADVDVARRLADYVAVGLSHHRLAEEGRRAAALRERTTNLEMLDGLLSTITGVLDIRQVFDRISTIAQRVLPHDALSIAESTDSGTRVRVHASHGLGNLPEPFDYPAPERSMVTEPWQFRLIDDVHCLPQFATHPATVAGMRSMLFNSIRLEGRLFGGLNFYSKTPGHFVQDDVLVARRITDHVALAISHWRLAEQVRHNEELRARTSNLELLDDLLDTLVDSGELQDVFGRLSAIARKVLPHEASALLVRMPDGRHARLVASTGFKTPLPEVNELPEQLVRNPDWEHDIFDDLSKMNELPYRNLASLGFRSLLRVPIRLEKKFAAGLLFMTTPAAAYKQSDSLIAHRIADRLAVAVARAGENEASKRADEATVRASKLESRVKQLTEELDSRTGYRRVVGESREWHQVLKQATQVASTDTTALLLGESGTGKEVVARLLHRGSTRHGGPFIALNCAALPEQLLEAELFGYERGAFTGATQSKPGQLEQAAGGTLFLDEVGEMSPSAQAKFLRVLQEREFQRLGGTRVLRTDTRVVAATNRDLQRAITQGQFREDLYYRLNVFAIRLPPLRDRGDDILPLSEAFLAEIGRSLGRPPAGISRDARQLLTEYHWPGNVRELRNILERAAILCDGGLITAEHLALTVTATPPPAPRPVAEASTTIPADRFGERQVPSGDLATMERTMIEEALRNARFNKSKAAKALGLTRHQLYIRMRKHGLE